MSSNVGVPVKLLFEAEGMKITVEMKNGEIYRGLLLSAEDTMNVSLSEVLRTARNGQISKLPNVYLRGSSIRFIALPDLLKSAPIFQKVATQKRKMEEAATQRQGGAKKRKRD
jgi:small nuclear ribonucleoprotein D3